MVIDYDISNFSSFTFGIGTFVLVKLVVANVTNDFSFNFSGKTRKKRIFYELTMKLKILVTIMSANLIYFDSLTYLFKWFKLVASESAMLEDGFN